MPSPVRDLEPLLDRPRGISLGEWTRRRRYRGWRRGYDGGRGSSACPPPSRGRPRRLRRYEDKGHRLASFSSTVMTIQPAREARVSGAVDG